MKLALGSLASGSSGNCYLIKSDTTNIIVDAGISGKQVLERLKMYGVEELPDAMLLTHEHLDHVKSVPVLSKKGIKVFATRKTFENIAFSKFVPELNEINAGDEFEIGDISIRSFRLSHDAADPVGYSFSKDGACISIITDTGYVTKDCFKYMEKSDVLVLESNHDESMLRIGSYPYFLKQRILSEVGHLSNVTAANALLSVLKKDSAEGDMKKRTVLLAHLSKENNFPEMAYQTMNNILESSGFRLGRDVNVTVLKRNEPSPLYEL